MHMEVRALRWCPLGVLYLVFEVLVSHWDLKLTDSAAEPQGSACLCSPSTELTRVSHHMLSSEPPPPQPLGGNFLSNRGSTFLSRCFPGGLVFDGKEDSLTYGSEEDTQALHPGIPWVVDF